MADRPHVISALVEDKPGVLTRIASMFRRRQFNIQSLTVGVSEERDMSRMTIVVDPAAKVDQVVSQLAKLIEVVRVRALDDANTLVRETALVQLKLTPAREEKIKAFVKQSKNTRVIDKIGKIWTLRISGTPADIDTAAKDLKKVGLYRIARTGAAALPRD